MVAETAHQAMKHEEVSIKKEEVHKAPEVQVEIPHFLRRSR